MKDPEHLAALRKMNCAMTSPLNGIPVGCSGPIEAHHRTGAGLALKADDHEAFPLCLRHHRDFHDAKGIFAKWTKTERKEWQNRMVAEYAPTKEST